jgi:fucose permease
MPSSERANAPSAKALTFAAYIAFVPIGIATVLLGPMLPTLSARWELNYSQAGALFTSHFRECWFRVGDFASRSRLGCC